MNIYCNYLNNVYCVSNYNYRVKHKDELIFKSTYNAMSLCSPRYTQPNLLETVHEGLNIKSCSFKESVG